MFVPSIVDAAFGPGAPDEVVHPVERAEERRLPAAGRPDDAQDLVPADVESDPPERPDAPEPVAEVPDGRGDHEYFLMNRSMR